jgi:hypothetical protein
MGAKCSSISKSGNVREGGIGHDKKKCPFYETQSQPEDTISSS